MSSATPETTPEITYEYHQTYVPGKFKHSTKVPKYLRADQPKTTRRTRASQNVLSHPDFYRLNAAELMELLANKPILPSPKRQRKKGKRKKRRKKKSTTKKPTRPTPLPPKLPSNNQLHKPVDSKAWTSLTVSTQNNQKDGKSPIPTPSTLHNTQTHRNIPTSPDGIVKKNHILLNNRSKKSVYSHTARTHVRLEEKLEKARREAQPWMFKSMVNNATRLGTKRTTPGAKKVAVTGAANKWKDFSKEKDRDQNQNQNQNQNIATSTETNTGLNSPKKIQLNSYLREPNTTTTSTNSTISTNSTTTTTVPTLNLQQPPIRPPGKKQHRDFVRHNKVQSARCSTENKRTLLTQRSHQRQQVYARASQLKDQERIHAEVLVHQREKRRALRLRGDENEARKIAWLKIIQLTNITTKFKKSWDDAKEKEIDVIVQKSAIGVILGAWGRKNAKKKGETFRGAYVTVQRACFTLIMRRRRTMKRRAAGRIMNFVLGIASQRFRGVMLRFRTCVVRAQRLWRSFQRCKHARILALNYIWDEVELELRIIEKRNRTKRLRKMLRTLSETSPWLNAAVRRERVIARRRQADKINRSTSDDLTAVIEGEKVDGVQFVVGDRAAALLDHHLRDGLRMIMKRNEIKAQLVEPVPFDIRFEVLHVLLTELRKKHAVDIASAKQLYSKEHVEITREELTTFSPHNSSLKNQDMNGENKIPLPPFIVYSTLGEASLLTIVNAGRQMFDQRKTENLRSKFNIVPLYTPDYDQQHEHTMINEDDIISELAQDAKDKRNLIAATKRKKNNLIAKHRIEKVREKNKKSKNKKGGRNRNNKEMNAADMGSSAKIVKIPAGWKSKRW